MKRLKYGPAGRLPAAGEPLNRPDGGIGIPGRLTFVDVGEWALAAIVAIGVWIVVRRPT